MRKPLKVQRHLQVNRVIRHVDRRYVPSECQERLISAAIVRAGRTHGGHKTHADIRRELGDNPSYESDPRDVEGFMTSQARFVDRRVARMIAIDAGQVPPSFNRTLLSSDVRW